MQNSKTITTLEDVFKTRFLILNFKKSYRNLCCYIVLKKIRQYSVYRIYNILLLNKSKDSP